MKNGSMRALLAVALAAMVFWAHMPLRADDYKSAHRVEPGDIISADMLNELFEEIEEARRTITADDLVGTWKGASYGPRNAYEPEWFFSDEYQCWSLTNVTIVFSKVATDHYEVATSAPNPFESDRSLAVSGRVGVVEGKLFGACGVFTIDRISGSRIRLTRDAASIVADIAQLVALDRQNIPPRKPRLLSASASSQDVVLTWQDNSDDEDVFVVLRRDKLSGSYSNVCTVAADVTCWTNTVPAAGFYWYRIAATNSCGSSLGSNVKRVVVP